MVAWEEGRAAPSLSQLKSLADAYRRPLVTFFLNEPPIQVSPLLDYRTFSTVPPESLEFSTLKCRIYQLHRELYAIAKDEQAKPLSFVGSCTMDDGILTTVDAIRHAFCMIPTDKTFSIIRDKAQRAGVYIILMGDLGNYKSRVDPEEFRGIAIADQIAPLIVINRYDTQAAMLFTLVHELAHIFLGSSGVSNQNIFESAPLHKSIEKFCNGVAAEFLVPEGTLRSFWNVHQCENLECLIECLAHNFAVSSYIISRRLFDLKLIKEDLYKRREKNKGSLNPNILRYNLGSKTLGTLSRAIDSGLITLLDAARTLNMSVSCFEKLVRCDNL